MEKAFDTGTTKAGFNKKPRTQKELINQHRALWLVVAFTIILFLALGWVNYRTGRTFNLPETITYKNAVYQTEGEIITGEDLVDTGDKVGNIKIYTKELKPGESQPIPSHQIWAKAGEDFVVYVLREEK